MADPKKLKADVVVQIGEIKVPIKDTGKKSMDIDTGPCSLRARFGRSRQLISQLDRSDRRSRPVRPVTAERSDRSHQRPGQVPAPRFEYRIKEKKEEQKPIADPKKSKADVVQIGEIKVLIKDTGKKLMDIEESADVPSQKPVIANDHEAGCSKSTADKYHQPRWCPSGLTHTQKRKLQRLHNKEKKEQENEKMRDEDFNRYRPMFPLSKVWKVKTGHTALTNRSDR